MIKINALHLRATLDAETRFESTAALHLVDPDQPDEATPSGHLSAIDERPRPVIVVVLQLLLLSGDPPFPILLERLLPGTRVSGPRLSKKCPAKRRTQIMEGGSNARHAEIGVSSDAVGRQGFTNVLELCGREWISHVPTSNGTASGYAAPAWGSGAP